MGISITLTHHFIVIIIEMQLYTLSDFPYFVSFENYIYVMTTRNIEYGGRQCRRRPFFSPPPPQCCHLYHANVCMRIHRHRHRHRRPIFNSNFLVKLCAVCVFVCLPTSRRRGFANNFVVLQLFKDTYYYYTYIYI